ncbi:hypothetical protein LWI28_000742 [Acer negundo]|uniref:F-box associated beta-propeller type 3 domain-containing protein n=1 Tax=Acer negundo TaxID=4023 RepID=A0AAD5ISP8_ACENE|nr:hypothetical protein LWI28_000742 [Acer negundo]
MPEFDVIGSCNCLLCLKGPSPMNELYIYNPFTRDHLELPGSTLDFDKEQVFGFGFHPSTKEYKVVKIVHYKNAFSALSVRENSTVKRSEAYILTLGSSGTWRSIEKFPYTIIRWPMSIDLADEKLREVPIPASKDFKGMCGLVVLGGCLSVVFYRIHGIIEIWVMKKYDVRESWIREFCIGDYVPRQLELEPDVDPSFSLSKLYDRRRHIKVLCLLKSGEILLEYMYRVLVSYDPKSGTFQDLSFPGMLNWFETSVHVGSLNRIDTLNDMQTAHVPSKFFSNLISKFHISFKLTCR